jgi:glycosyltransferase involved in cell wall biosynthesis
MGCPEKSYALMTKVSVCMITYNHEKYIEHAIYGVLSQNFDFDVELIISDDASSDKTQEKIIAIVNKNESNVKIRYFRNTENVGMMKNFISTIGKCQGEYIALCDGDDYWTDPYKLQKQVDFLEDNQDYGICFHKVKILKGVTLFRDSVIEERYENIKKFPVTVLDLLKQGNFIHTASVVFRHNIKSFPIEFTYSSVGDYFLHIMNAQYGYIKRLDDAMAVYRASVGIYSTLSPRDMTKRILQYNSCILSYLSNPEEKEVLLKKQIAIISGLEIIQKRQDLTIENLHSELSFKNILNILIKKVRKKINF